MSTNNSQRNSSPGPQQNNKHDLPTPKGEHDTTPQVPRPFDEAGGAEEVAQVPDPKGGNMFV
jgi:hypothetical protein